MNFSQTNNQLTPTTIGNDKCNRWIQLTSTPYANLPVARKVCDCFLPSSTLFPSTIPHTPCNLFCTCWEEFLSKHVGRDWKMRMEFFGLRCNDGVFGVFGVSKVVGNWRRGHGSTRQGNGTDGELAHGFYKIPHSQLSKSNGGRQGNTNGVGGSSTVIGFFLAQYRTRVHVEYLRQHV